MNALLASAILTLLSARPGPVTLNVDAQNGDTITGERTFRVTVAANNAVTGVEFYVGGELRDKATATPYMFTLDSLSESEGDLPIKFKAYTTEGESGEKSLTVHIDNQLSKGLDFHLQAGTESLQDGKFDAAVTSGRIALKIDPKSNPARIVVSRAYLAKKQFDKAQKYAEDALADDPSSPAASDLLSNILLKEAFTTYNREGDRRETLATIRDEMTKAVEIRRKTVDAALDKLGGLTDANAIAFADASLVAGHFSSAINALEPLFKKDQRRTDVANRLIYAELRIGRRKDALATYTELKEFGQPDSYTGSLAAILYAELGDAALSDAALKDALVANPDDPAVLCAQAYVALKFFRSTIVDKVSLQLNYDKMTSKSVAARRDSLKLMQSALDQLQRSQTGHSEVDFYAEALNNKLEEFGPAEHAFERSVLADPLNVDAFIEQGNRSIGDTFKGQPSADEKDQALGAARAYYETALAARDNSPQALCGLALVATIQGKYDEATRWGGDAVKAAPSYPAGYVILATAYSLQAAAQREGADALRKQNLSGGTTNEERQANEVKTRTFESAAGESTRKAREALEAGGRLDPRLEGFVVTKPQTAWEYFYVGGRLPLLPLPH
jgi:Tfp pilus assembly protein PilF